MIEMGFKATLETFRNRYIRYNVATWRIKRGIVPLTSTVTLDYVDGRIETFHWVIIHTFEVY